MINQGRALAYRLQNLEAVFQETYPGFISPEAWPAEYQIQVETALTTLRTTLQAVQQQSEDFAAEQARLTELQNMSDAAIGRMQAIQAGNMLTSEVVQQLAKLRQLMMTQINANNAALAHQINDQAQTDALAAEWLQSGTRTLSTPTDQSFGPQDGPQLRR